MPRTNWNTNYSNSTINAPNPLRRLAHRNRYEIALALAGPVQGQRVLDYGCGDGFFIEQLAARTIDPLVERGEICGFEPFQEIRASCKLTVFRKWEDVLTAFRRDGPAYLVTCFEVFEHLAQSDQVEAIGRIRSIMRSDGVFLISVPIECGLAAVPKNVLRRRAWNWQASRPEEGWNDLYTITNVMRSIFELPIPEHRSGRDYLSHMGFYFRDLEKLLERQFLIELKKFSPLPFVPTHHLNSQVFYRLRPLR